MVQVVYLRRGEQMPDRPEDEPWLTVEASDDGRFFGAGYGFEPSGQGVFYAFLPESEVTLEAALAAATKWAGERGVRRICVQTIPD